MPNFSKWLLKDDELCLPENTAIVKNDKKIELVNIQDVKSNGCSQPLGLANTLQLHKRYLSSSRLMVYILSADFFS